MSSRFSLRITSGVHDGEQHELEGPRVTVGRKPGNSLRLEESSVSGTHAELLIEGGTVTLRDRNSTNGTKVGGSAIDERVLAHGDQVTFGSVQALFEDDTQIAKAAQAEQRARLRLTLSAP